MIMMVMMKNWRRRSRNIERLLTAVVVVAASKLRCGQRIRQRRRGGRAGLNDRAQTTTEKPLEHMEVVYVATTVRSVDVVQQQRQVNQVEGVTRCNTFRLNGLILITYNRIKMLFISYSFIPAQSLILI